MNNISVSFSQLDKRIKYICVFTRWTISFCTLKRRKSDRIVWQFVTEKIQGPSLLAARAESTLASRHRKLHAADNFTRRSRYIGVITIITSVFLPWFFCRTLWEVYYFFFFFTRVDARGNRYLICGSLIVVLLLVNFRLDIWKYIRPFCFSHWRTNDKIHLSFYSIETRVLDFTRYDRSFKKQKKA